MAFVSVLLLIDSAFEDCCLEIKRIFFMLIVKYGKQIFVQFGIIMSIMLHLINVLIAG